MCLLLGELLFLGGPGRDLLLVGSMSFKGWCYPLEMSKGKRKVTLGWDWT